MPQPQRGSGPDQSARIQGYQGGPADQGFWGGPTESICPNRKEVVDLINLQEYRGTRVAQLIKDSGMVQQSLYAPTSKR